MREQLYACEPNYILGYLDRLENASEEELKLAASMFDDDDEDKDPVDDIYEEEGDEARITVDGILTMNGPSPIARFFGDEGTSYKSIQAACNRAAASACKSVTFAINSPGGEVNGCDQTWQAVRALAAVKPCKAINSGMMASAAYWIASAVGPNNIFADSPACEQGSIGVKVVAIDDSGMGEKLGIKRVQIVSKNAPNKSDDISKKAGLNAIQARCDQMEAVFVDRVAAGRGISKEKVLADFGQGAVLISADAKAAGMIDDIIPPAGMPQSSAPGPSSPDNFSRMRPGALAAVHTPESGRNPMTLKELLATDPAALAEYNAALKAQFDAGASSVQARITTAKPFLALSATKDGYSTAEAAQIAKCAVDVISGTEDPGALRAFVRMVDMQVETRKGAHAATETDGLPETPPQKLEADAALLAKAAALKINVADLTARALAAKMDPMAALQAEIENLETLAADRARMGA